MSRFLLGLATLRRPRHNVGGGDLRHQGRITQELGPSHEVDGDAVRTATWTVYQDADHQTWTARGYASGDPGNYACTLVNPVSITKYDAAGRVLEQIQAVRATTDGRLSPDDSFAQESYVRWTVNGYANERLAWTRAYFDIPSTGEGTDANYAQTSFDYDAQGRRNYVRTPGGTITRTVFDGFDRPTAVYVGTNDAGATDADPTPPVTRSVSEAPLEARSASKGPSQLSPNTNNLVLVTASIYAADGSDNLVQQIQHVDDTTTRITTFQYDWRNRRQYEILPPDAEGRQTYTRYSYDNLDRPILAERYYDADHNQNFPADAVDPGDQLLARTETLLDDRGQVYQTKVYGVDPDTGAPGNALIERRWYDAAGQVIKHQPSGSQAFTKTVYDALGRTLAQYTGYDTDETAWADAASVADDVIVEQVENAYDPAGNVLQTTRRQRLHNAPESQTGPLGDLESTFAVPARVSYSAAWYDGARRLVATADYGTNGNAPLALPASPPDRSDDVLVTTLNYNDRGEVVSTVDPAGIEARTEFDHAGRKTRQIANYREQTVTSDQNITVEYQYNLDGALAALTAKNPDTGDQVTRYVYGTTLADSAIARADLLRAEIYPDSGDTVDPLGDGPDGIYDRIEYTYNRQGQRVTKKDQNGTVHEYHYDPLGRPIADAVTTLGEGVDGAVQCIATAYDVRGQVEFITSYDTPTMSSIANQLKVQYNAFGQPVTEYQEHDGAVNVSSTSKVGYTYSDGSANHVRLLAMTYPNGRVLQYDYDAGMDDSLSRVSGLSDLPSPGTGEGLGVRVASYARLGLNTIVRVEYPEPNLRGDLAFGTTADPYSGLDRFGRVTDLRWWNPATGNDVERIRHGYDRAGNRLWRECPVAQQYNVNQDELYAFDHVNRLVSMNRGKLNDDRNALVNGTLAFAEQWQLDATGNWKQYRRDDNGDGNWELDQSRTHNPVNEITALAGQSAYVGHDRNGNMLATPKPNDWSSDFHLTYDAWNRLVEVREGATNALVARYAYDGRNYRIRKTGYQDGQISRSHDYDYNNQWQMLEERISSPHSSSTSDVSPASSGGEAPFVQYIWGPRYIDALVLRDRDLGRHGEPVERLYALQDPNWNVTGIVASTGMVQECYGYSSYGTPLVFDATYTAAAGSPHAWEYLFAGRPVDVSAGNYYNRNRDHRHSLGCFANRDPLEADHNLYRYCANNPLVHTDPTGEDWLDCMAECIKDNDPLPYALGAGIKAILLSGGWETKAMIAQMFKVLGYTELANDILHYANMPGASKLTNIMSTIGTVLSKMGATQSTAMWHKIGGAASSILGPIEVAYGLALAAIEVHCAGWCCTASWYGISYNHADGNVIDTWKYYYFGKWL